MKLVALAVLDIADSVVSTCMGTTRHMFPCDCNIDPTTFELVAPSPGWRDGSPATDGDIDLVPKSKNYRSI